MRRYLYDYERMLARQIELLEQEKISEKNKKLILKFRDYDMSMDISMPRIIRVVITLRIVARRTGKDFGKITRADYEKLFAEMKQERYALESLETFKKILKVFHKWLNGNEHYPDCVKWFRFNNSSRRKKLPEDLLIQEDVKRLIKYSNSKRDKALIASLWESGARIGELGTMCIKHLAFDRFGCKALLDGKTGMRRIRLVNSAPYLVEWINSHPDSKNPSAPLWVNIGQGMGKQMEHPCIMKMLRVVAKHAGIKKPVNPHHFRHSRATYMANHLTEAQMKEYFGWVQDSDMAARYVHLSGKQVDDAVLRMHGLKQEERKEDILKREPCPRCKEMNDINNEYCSKCWLPITPEAHRDIQEMEHKDQKAMIAVIKLIQLAQGSPEKVREAVAIMQQEAART